MNDTPRPHHATGSSFHLPMRFLSPVKRRAMHTLYAFCRQADDAVDEAADPQEARKSLLSLRAAIHNIYGNPRVTSADPLRAVIQQYSLKREYFDAILDGMEMDARGMMLRPDLATLTLYCYRVAGCVGLLSVAIFGAHEPSAEKFAAALGHALQLTNILRDIEEDAALGRLYLPLEWLKEEGIAGIRPDALSDYKEAVGRVCARLAQNALHYFAEAEILSHDCNRRRLIPALLMRDIYRSYLRAMMRQNDYLAAHKVRLGFLRKLGVAMGAWRYFFS